MYPETASVLIPKGFPKGALGEKSGGFFQKSLPMIAAQQTGNRSIVYNEVRVHTCRGDEILQSLKMVILKLSQ